MPKCEPRCTCGRHRGQTGNDPLREYRTRHKRVYYKRGSAKLQTCVECSGPAQEWSQTHDTDGESPEDYRPMCRKCHRAYDGWPEMISEAQRRRWAALSSEERTAYFKEHEEAISDGLKRMWADRTPEERAELGKKVGEAQKGKFVSDETRARISESKKQAANAKKEAANG